MWIIVDGAFDLLVIGACAMVAHEGDAMIIVKLLYGAMDQGSWLFGV